MNLTVAAENAKKFLSMIPVEEITPFVMWGAILDVEASHNVSFSKEEKKEILGIMIARAF